jgi:hypothetical protein
MRRKYIPSRALRASYSLLNKQEGGQIASEQLPADRQTATQNCEFSSQKYVQSTESAMICVKQ